MDNKLNYLVMALIVLMLAIGFVGFCKDAHAGQVTVTWDHNNPLPDGYRVYYTAYATPFNFDSWGCDTTENRCTFDVPDNLIMLVGAKAYLRTPDGKMLFSELSETPVFAIIKPPINIMVK